MTTATKSRAWWRELADQLHAADYRDNTLAEPIGIDPIPGLGREIPDWERQVFVVMLGRLREVGFECHDERVPVEPGVTTDDGVLELGLVEVSHDGEQVPVRVQVDRSGEVTAKAQFDERGPGMVMVVLAGAAVAALVAIVGVAVFSSDDDPPLTEVAGTSEASISESPADDPVADDGDSTDGDDAPVDDAAGDDPAAPGDDAPGDDAPSDDAAVDDAGAVDGAAADDAAGDDAAADGAVTDDAAADGAVTDDVAVDDAAGEVEESRGVIRDGKIFLTGAVPTQADIDRIVALASEILGPENVINDYYVDERASDPDDGAISVQEAVLFESGSAVIADPFKPLLDQGVLLMQIRPAITFTVAGHTDALGDADVNQALSVERAEAVVDYMVSKGVERERFTAVGFGETWPIGDNDTATGRRLNRRIELRIENLLAE